MRVLGKVALSFVVCIVVLGAWMQRQMFPTHRYLPWHGTPQWHHFLGVYDRLAAQYFGSRDDCQSQMLSTSFGQTQVHVCGSAEDPPVLLLHGAGSNALIYGQWLLPNLTATHHTIAVDYPCDTGRSIPPEGDPELCPQTQEALADWVSQVLQGVGVSRRTSLIGYSYGAFISFVTALHRPDLVDKLVLLAPAGTFVDLSPAFLWHAVVYALFRSERSHQYFLKWISADPNYDLLQSPPDDLEQLVSIREVAATVLAVQTETFNSSVLEQVLDNHPTLLGLGEDELLLQNVTHAAERARRAGAAQVKLYPQAGHLMLIEASDAIVRDVVSFLTSREVA